MNDHRLIRTPSSYLFTVFILLVAQGLVLASLTTVWAQDLPDRSAVEREIHVEFAPGTVALPEGQTQATPQELTTEAPALQEVFQQVGVEMVSKTFPEFEPADTTAVTRTGERVRLGDVSRVFTLRLPSEAGIGEAVERLTELPQVVFAERNGRATTHALTGGQVNPSDNFFGTNGEQWNLLNTGQDGGKSDADVDAPEAWDITTGNSNTTIGIIDSGVENGHADLNGKVSGDGVTGAHGTHVAGIAAAKTDNGKGIAGVNWKAQIYDKAAIGSGGGDSGLFNDVMDAVQSGNADILNNSYSLCKAGTCNDPKPEPRYSTLVRRAYANAYRMNVVSTASMGNSGDNRKYYPSGFDQEGIIAVGATNRNDTRASFSTTGSHIDVAAPGKDVMSTFPPGAHLNSDCKDSNNDGYGLCSGTSMAAPHVSGIAGLLLAENSNLYNDDIEHIIRLSAEDKGAAGFDPQYGKGRVNARKALEYLQSPYAVRHWAAQGGTSVESWNFTGTFYDLPGAPNGNYVGTTHRVRTTVSFPESFSSVEDVWGRGVASTGYSAATTNFSVPYCRVVSHTATSVTLETFVHDVSRTDGSYAGWYPVKPSNIECAYTVLGKPGAPPLDVTLSGPTWRDNGEQGTWTASVSGGSGSASYDWEYQSVPSSTNWYSANCSGASCSHTFYNYSSNQVEQGKIRVTVTKGSEQDQASRTVNVNPAGGYSSSLAKGRAGAFRALDARAEKSGIAEVRWSTRASRPASEFVVEHRRDSTAAWSELGSVAAGDSVSADTSRGAAYRFRAEDLSVGTHQFRLRVQAEGAKSLFTSRAVTAEIRLAEAFEVETYPNPVRNQSTIELAVREKQDVTVAVYDVLGRRVTTVHDGTLPAQEARRFGVNASEAGLSSGTYFVRVRGEAFAETRRLTVVR